MPCPRQSHGGQIAVNATDSIVAIRKPVATPDVWDRLKYKTATGHKLRGHTD